MATIRNTRDKILQAQVPRNLNPSADKILLMTTDTPVFNVSNTNVGSPAVITFTAKPLNIPVAATLTVTAGTATLGGIGNVRTLAYTDMLSESVTVTATVVYQGITYTAIAIVSKVRQGQDGDAGSDGSQGTSARIAYTLVNSASLNSTPSSANVTGDFLPSTGTWGETNPWQITSPTSYVAGQSVWVSNGLYNPETNITTWNVPYLANLKVGSLSVLTPNLGSITEGALNINNRFVVLADGTTSITSGADNQYRVIVSASDPTYAMWIGTDDMTDGNAIMYVKKNGDSYFGGSLSAGVLRTSVTNPTLGNTQIIDGPFGSRGNTVTIVSSVNRNFTRSSDNHTYSVSGPAPSATMTLYRTLAGSSEQLLQTSTITGVTNITNDEADGTSFARQITSGSFTLPDPITSNLDHTYRLTVTVTDQTVIATLKVGKPDTQMPSSTTQSLTIVTTEP